MTPEHHPIAVTVNGSRVATEVTARTSLADLLRMQLGLTGTHLGCEHGVCGTCTVLVDGQPARACLMLAVQAHGRRVETVESLSDGEVLHPIQEAFVRRGALQCGFCTPGFLMVALGLTREDPTPGPAAVRDLIASNLCRCTGYEPIAQAISDCIANGR